MNTATRFHCALTLISLVLVGGSGLEARAERPSASSPKDRADLTEAQKRGALLAARPGLPPSDVAARVKRLETAWSRAQDEGLLKGTGWMAEVEAGRRSILVNAYVDRLPGHRLDEAQIKAAYLAQPEQRRVSHLLCAAEGEARAALARVQAGEPFDKVASEVSKDPSAAANRGSLGWIRREQMVKAFGDPVFEAEVGSLVGPLQSEFGWHVAKVWERRRPDASEYPAQRESLMQEARRIETRMKRDKALEHLRRRFPLAPDLKVLAADRTTEALPGDDRRIAGRVAGVAISLKALKVHLADALKTMGQSHSLGAATKTRFMEGLADEIRLAVAAKGQGLEQRPDVRAALWLEMRSRARTRYAAHHLASIRVSDTELRTHLDTHPDRFRPVGAVRMQVLVADSQNGAEEALAAVRNGTAWREAAARFGSPEATGDPEPGWVEVADLRKLVPSSLMQPILGGALHQPLGPMLGPDGFMIFNVLERRPGALPPLEECRAEVRRDYLEVHGDRLLDEALDALNANP